MASCPSEHRDDEYVRLLQSKNLWPVDPMTEFNWSGRGQHTYFHKHETKDVAKILEVRDTLGSTTTAMVQSVKCRRILLARKTIRCSRGITRSDVIEEVAHITKLDHSHIVRVIGTYVMRRDLSILLYPVAEYNLQSFLEHIVTADVPEATWRQMAESCRDFFGCLSSALAHIHDNCVKHMDIKPPNILVRDVRATRASSHPYFKVYITDFGIARAYQNFDATETDGLTAFTKKYASPEVTIQELRGLSADIFSLGCVFLELLTAVSDTYYVLKFRKALPMFLPRSQHEYKKFVNQGSGSVQQLKKTLLRSSNSSYQANLSMVHEFISNLVDADILRDLWTPDLKKAIQIIPQMLANTPKERPTAQFLATAFQSLGCCQMGGEELALPTID
jgi:serine/threonine protein kinase